MIIGIVLIVGVVSVLAYMYAVSGTTNNTPEAITNVYVAAAQQGDQRTLAGIAAPNHVIDQAVEEKIQLYRMGQVRNIQLTKVPTESILSVEMRIQGDLLTPDGVTKPFQDQIYLTKTRAYWFLPERWFVVLGTYSNNQPAPPKRPSAYN